jgi:hypothetical protein
MSLPSKLFLPKEDPTIIVPLMDGLGQSNLQNHVQGTLALLFRVLSSHHSDNSAVHLAPNQEGHAMLLDNISRGNTQETLRRYSLSTYRGFHCPVILLVLHP